MPPTSFTSPAPRIALPAPTEPMFAVKFAKTSAVDFAAFKLRFMAGHEAARLLRSAEQERCVQGKGWRGRAGRGWAGQPAEECHAVGVRYRWCGRCSTRHCRLLVKHQAESRSPRVSPTKPRHNPTTSWSLFAAHTA